jgi:hypothetical protein
MRACRTLAALMSICLALAACDGDSPEQAPPEARTLLEDPLSPLPASFSATGLYRDGRAASPAIAYEPVYALWSNGSRKERFLVLPEGGRVDNRVARGWSFPVGTLFFKTFSYEVGGSPGTFRPVETRILRRAESRWEFAAYEWNKDGKDAALLPLDRSVPVAVEAFGEAFEHRIPSRIDCRKCHETNATMAIGFDELRLNGPGAGAENQLAALEARGVFEVPVSKAPEFIDEADETARAVRGYLNGNCAHCHNAGDAANSAFDLRPEISIENLVGRPTDAEGGAVGIRVVPGDPDASVMFLAFSGEDAGDTVKDMPPVGVQRRDRDAIELFRTWILSLPPAN